MLEPGAKMPAFSLPDQSGQKKKLNDLSGPQGLILFVYTKNM